MQKLHTQQYACLIWFFMWYFCQICTSCTSTNNTEMHLWCNLSYDLLYILVQLKPCTIIMSVVSDKYDSHICYMPIWDHSGNHHIDKCSQHVCFSVWTVSCYLHAYNTEWYHLYCTLHRELCPWQLITCIRCLVRHIQRSFLHWQRESPPCTFDATTQFITCIRCLGAKDGYMSSLFIEMKMIHQIISDESSR